MIVFFLAISAAAFFVDFKNIKQSKSEMSLYVFFLLIAAVYALTLYTNITLASLFER